MIEQMRKKRVEEQEKRSMEMLKSIATEPPKAEGESAATDYFVLSFAAVCWLAFIVFYNFY